MLSPAGSPVAVNVYGPPAPPLAVTVTGVMATPWVALIVTKLQLELIDGYTVIEQHTVPWWPFASVIVTV
jgi:hypothetical protein